MIWLLWALLVALVLLILYFVLTVDWRSVLSRRRPRTWQEGHAGGPEEEQPPVHERVRRRLRSLLQTADQVERPAPQVPPKRSAPSVELKLSHILLAIVLLLAALLLSRYLIQRFPPRRPHRLTIVISEPAMDAEMTAPRIGDRQGEDLQASLQQALEEAGLASLVRLRLVNETPADSDQAHDLARHNDADLLLWGWVQDQDGRSQYYLKLVFIPRIDPEVPEFDEYYRVMVTPPHLPLTRPGEGSGLPPNDVADVLTWLAHFYLGEFDQVEERPPEVMERPGLYNELLVFHWGALHWLGGKYSLAQTAYEKLIGTETSPQCPPEITAPLCAAASNNQAVVLITLESLGEYPPPWLKQALSLLSVADKAYPPPSPQSMAIQYNLGRVHLGLGQWDPAIKVLSNVVDFDDQHGPALAALSEAHRKLGGRAHLKQASSLADRAISVDPDLAAGQLALGRYLLAIDEVRRANRAFDRALELAKGEESRRRSQEAARREGPQPNLDRARYLAAWADRNAPALADAYLAQAELFLTLGRQEQLEELSFFVSLWRTVTGEPGPLDIALDKIGQALSKHPDWYEALCLRGETYQVKGEVDQAITSYELAQDQDPENERAYLGLASAREAQWRAARDAGDAEQAQERLEQAQAQYLLLVNEEINPARGYFGLGELARERKDWTAARQAYLDAVRENPNYAAAYLRLGQVELQLNNETEALRCFDQAIQAAGPSPVRINAHIERGQIFLEQYLWTKQLPPIRPDLLEDARKAFSAALEISAALRTRQEPPRALNGLGRVTYEEGNYQQAQEYFAQVLATNPSNFGALYGIGRVYEAQAQSRLALEYLDRAVKSNKDDIAARYHLAVAYYAQLQEDKARQAFQQVQEKCQASVDQERRSADAEESCRQVSRWLAQLKEAP